jgi:cyclophilin family peptidyl-prolyl cis-trans isomerase
VLKKELINRGKHVVFGEIVEGMEIIKQLEKLGSREGRVSTSRKSLVRDCGIVDEKAEKAEKGDKGEKGEKVEKTE